MPLTIAIDEVRSNVGIAVPTAYARISRYSFDDDTDTVEVAVNVYASAQARNQGKSPITGGVYSGILNGPAVDGNPAGPTGLTRNAIYTWLKTLPDFTGAIDN